MKPTQDLQGKTILITGASSGIGYAAATELASRGAYIIGIGRSEERCKEAERAIRNLYPDAKLSFLIADLSSLRQIRQLAEEIRAKTTKLDVLVNNAGTVSSWYMATEDGYELQFAVNHLAPVLLSHELLPLLQAAPDARVITVSSGSHFTGKIHWNNIMSRKHYNILKAYDQSKLANILFTAEFNRHYGDHVRAYAVDPGLVNTSIGLKGTGQLEQWFWKLRRSGGVTPEKGAETIIHLAATAKLESSDAIYWKDCHAAEPSQKAYNLDDASRLWELSQRLCGVQEAVFDMA